MIEPKYKTLKQLFTDRVFQIPKYQRFYSWLRKQRADLFTDLETLRKRPSDQHHFMATIVCHRTKEIKNVGATDYHLDNVVDGQQRLTTIIILLKCIETAMSEDDDERKELGKLLVKRDGILILLQTNNTNDQIFNAFLRDGKRTVKAAGQTQADRTLIAAISECDKFVSDWRSTHGELISLLSLIQNRLGFVVYDTDDDRVVYELFEILNSRGLGVDWMDKCKSMLIGQAYELATSASVASRTIESLHNIWGNIYKSLAIVRVDGEEILRVAATLRHGPKRGKPRNAADAYELLRDDCRTSNHGAARVCEYLLEVTNKLVTLQREERQGPASKILHARILAVALESTNKLSDKERRKALEQWERVTFRIFGLYGKDSRHKIGDYLRLATKVVNGTEGASRYSEIMQSLRDLGSGYSIEQAVAEGLRGKNVYESSPDLCRYLLWEYEKDLARSTGKGGTVDVTAGDLVWSTNVNDSLEHIFPQNPEPGGAWDKKMKRKGDKDQQEIAGHVHRIGNLVLMSQELNGEARRQGFVQKKEIYSRQGLRQAGEVCSEKDWTLQEIEAREERIAK